MARRRFDWDPERGALVISRADRIGDLVLSLPVLGHLGRAGVRRRVLQCSAYAASIGEWARFNGLCEEVWVVGSKPPAGVSDGSPTLILQHNETALAELKRYGLLSRSIGPRTKLSALWTYSHSIPQNRSRCLKSEMTYNVELASEALRWLGFSVPDFEALPALKVPTEWKAPEDSRATWIAVVSNGASAANRPVSYYVDEARRAQARGLIPEFLVSGVDAADRLKELRASGVERDGIRIRESLPDVKGLVAYLATAKEVLASSTGPLHIAHAAGVAVTGLYPKRPKVQGFRRWRPDGYRHAAPVRFIEF